MRAKHTKAPGPAQDEPDLIVTVTLNPAVDETLMVDALQVGETNRIQQTDIDPGGKGLNVARVVRRLGRPTVVIAFVGGETGHYIRNRLQREGVDLDLVEIERPTRINISIFDRSSHVQTNLNHEGPEVTLADLRALDHRLQRWLPEAVVACLGGSLPPGTPVDTYARLVDWLDRNDVKTILDTRGDALVEGVKAHPYLIKPNLREAETLLGRKLETDDQIVQAACELVSGGVEIVVISLGRRGAVAASHDGVWRACPPDVTPGTTTGAGDSMVAGLAISLYEHSGLVEGLALATAAATATVILPGTELAHADDVQRLLPEVKVERIR